jgi:hypothetical protein
VLANLNDVWGSGPAGGKVWVAGDEGTVLEYVSRGR